MVVNKEGDLELYAVHDAPKSTAWSPRGDLAIAAGLSCRILEGSRNDDNSDELLPSSSSHLGHSANGNGATTNENDSRSRQEPILRGRRKHTKTEPVVAPPPAPLPSKNIPLFGRGDEEGFPALGSSLSPVRDTGANGTAKKEHGDSQETGRVAGRNQTHSTSRARRSGGSTRKGVSLVVESDISMVMKRRVLRGYGLSEPQHNMDIVRLYDPPNHRTHMLVDLWAWIYHSHEYLCVPKSVLYGYDFEYRGLLDIWEGFQPAAENPDILPLNPYFDGQQYHDRRLVDELHGNFQAALGALSARRMGDRPWKPTVVTTKGLQRQIALQLLGWSLREDELASTLSRWEREGEISRVACWLVFTKQYTKAISLLMKSDDEAHCMLSGTVAALIPPHASRSTELREHYERLIVRLQDPYLRAMLTHLALNDWSEVLQEESLPFRERLAIAFLFLDDKAISSYLHRCLNRALSQGDIDGIIVPGLSGKSGLDILQGYVDRTGDIQTAAILGSYVCPPKNLLLARATLLERRVQRWVEGYQDLLDGFKLFHHRVGFDIERGQVALGKRGGTVAGDWVPRQILIRCNYCNKPVVPDGSGGGIGAEVQHNGRDAAREADLLYSHTKDPGKTNRSVGGKNEQNVKAAKRTVTTRDLARTYIGTVKVVGQKTTVKMPFETPSTVVKDITMDVERPAATRTGKPQTRGKRKVVQSSTAPVCARCGTCHILWE
ncbi:hypothetical protein DXG03_008004 [Asterophora parasitica]|uniref:MIOS-like alpha-solenoid domain-containing protein n=1 Tax=Asterophora parasitica TaxID=117018 RepID=A0A9P7G4B8_9AGAR|nr:hypothetical protein DXG03_008004 [Asterophora parasitica]